jgi:Protein of unknown function, DUF547
MRLAIVIALVVVCMPKPSAQGPPVDSARSKGFDQILDMYVRDGMVYYRALRQDRAALDAYISSVGGASVDSIARAEQIAFWLNAYNALVLRTVIDHYPIGQRTPNYPAQSIRQIPGAFEQARHRVAGRTMTLDQIEQTTLAGFGDPRVFLAMGRGALGSPRLRSEVYSADKLESQLAEVAAECPTRTNCFSVDSAHDLVSVSSVFSWRADNFVAAYAAGASAPFASRSPIERAVLAFVEAKLLPTEKEYLAKNQFKVAFKPFDWSLNDLTGRGGR